MIKFYNAEKKLFNGETVLVPMFKFHTGKFSIVNNIPQEEIIEGEVDEATKKEYSKEYDLFISGRSHEEALITPETEEEIAPETEEEIAPEITRASFFDEENN